MAIEIERKFLVRSAAWRQAVSKSEAIRQGYIAREGRVAVRVRQKGERFILTVKGEESSTTRVELEWPISAEEGLTLFAKACQGAPIEKTRHYATVDGHTFEIDEFHGRNEGLVVAELELEREDAPYPRPDWLGPEVSADPRYINARLLDAPFSTWAQSYSDLLRDAERGRA